MAKKIDKMKYIAGEIRDNYDDTGWVRRRINYHINGRIQQIFRPIRNSTYITNEEWDTLIVADAMKWELYDDAISDEYEDKFDRVEPVLSPGSSTPQWLNETFTESYGDTVYVAGNPQVSRHQRDKFHKLYEVWEDSYSEDDSVIDPKMVTDKAIEAREEHPNKKLIVHYMQPHYPFIGYPSLNYAEYDFSDLGLTESKEDKDVRSVWFALGSGLVDRDDVWEGYSSNAELVFDEIDRILESISDRVVVTSDHGNMIGDRSWPIPIREYGHPGNMRQYDLIKVPFLVREGESRDIVEEDVNSPKSELSDTISDQLSALGYK